jgi:hypothetical protein
MIQKVSRRTLLGGAITSTFALGLANQHTTLAATQLPPARAWRTWHLEDPSELRPEAPPPVSPDETAELIALQDLRNPTTDALAEKWVAQPAIFPWTEIALNRIIDSKPTPVRASRALALLHTAMFDAVAAAQDAQHAYPRSRPFYLDQRVQPLFQIEDDRATFPATEAVVAGAASTVLTYLFPNYPASLFKSIEEEATNVLLWSGVNVRSDIVAGLDLGRQIGERAVAWGESDGSDARWDGSNRPSGDGYWQPTPPAFVPEPLDPLAGTWRTWVLQTANQLRPPAPPPFGSALWQAELALVQDAVASRTQEQADAVLFWGGGPGTVTPAGLWTQIGIEQIRRLSLDQAEAARVLAYTSVAMHDAFLCCWDAKFTFWYPRPITFDPSLDTLIPTPPFPSYTSGHSTVSTAAASTLAHFFPDEGATLEAQGFEAKSSRLWAGIHYAIDNDMGAVGGGLVARLVTDRARSDLAG